MAYVAPDKATFLASFPAFAGLADAPYLLWSGQAVLVTGARETELGAQIDVATMLLTAHYLTQQGLGSGAEAEAYAGGMSGYSEVRSASLSLKRADGADMSGYRSTSYGQRFFDIMAPIVTGPRVTGTGTVPFYPQGVPWAY